MKITHLGKRSEINVYRLCGHKKGLTEDEAILYFHAHKLKIYIYRKLNL